MTSLREIVNGYGVIGKRVADAVVLQDDMELLTEGVYSYMRHPQYTGIHFALFGQLVH